VLGSVKKDGGRGTWLFVVDLPPAADGKRRQKKCRGFPTKKAAEAALSELVGRAQRGPIAEPGRQTLAGYLEGWLPGVRVSRTGSTASNYRWVLEAYVLPRIGGLRLAALQPNHLRSLYADLLESGSLGRGRDRVGRGDALSARTVSLVHRILHRALEDAVSDGLLPRNPAAAVKRPATPKSAAGKVWSADQARRFITSAAADRLEALWRLELSTGLRRAEAAGLRCPTST
jgi:integrase